MQNAVGGNRYACTANRPSLTRRPPDMLPASHTAHQLQQRLIEDYGVDVVADGSNFASYQRESVLSPTTAAMNSRSRVPRLSERGQSVRSDSDGRSHSLGHRDYTSGSSLTFDEIDARLSSLTQ